jgi:rhamnogalacturonyl hydrolase YesR
MKDFLKGKAALSATAIAFALLLMAPLQSAQSKPAAGNPLVGDTPATAGPLARDLSSKLTRRDVRRAIQKVADWQLAKASPGFDQDWTFAALYAGLMAVPDAAGGRRYRDAMLQIAKSFHAQPGPRIAHADDEAIGQTYLDLYEITHDPALLAPIRERMDAVMRIPGDPAKPLWWWCDALFMAPPVLAKLSRATDDPAYLNFMDREWWITADLLYSEKDHLFFRDKSFLHSREANGRSVYWSRGNGWVFAGLARVLAEMPQDYPPRPRYVALFRQMADEIASLQMQDGLWRAGLLDETAYRYPEVSGSAFFTYGFAYGINAGLLDSRRYKPVVQRAWKGLLTHVFADGRLGSIQPIGAAPGDFTPTSSYVYGTGAFLLAGSEVYRLAR